MVNFININFNLLNINQLANSLILNQISNIPKISLQITYKRFGKFNYSSYLYCIRKRDNNNN